MGVCPDIFEIDKVADVRSGSSAESVIVRMHRRSARRPRRSGSPALEGQHRVIDVVDTCPE